MEPKKPGFDFAGVFKGIPHPDADRNEASGVRLDPPLPPDILYPGRPNYCGGAYLANAYGKMTRTYCRDAAMPGNSLCASCAQAEKEMRDDLRSRARQSAEPAQDASKRNRWSR